MQRYMRHIGVALGILPPSPNVTRQLAGSELLGAVHLGILGTESEIRRAELPQIPTASAIGSYIEKSRTWNARRPSRSIIADMYLNLFDRAPDAEGHDYWNSVLLAHLAAASEPGMRGEAIAKVLLLIISGASPPDRKIMRTRIARLR